jgi:hypothetical protein
MLRAQPVKAPDFHRLRKKSKDTCLGVASDSSRHGFVALTSSVQPGMAVPRDFFRNLFQSGEAGLLGPRERIAKTKGLNPPATECGAREVISSMPFRRTCEDPPSQPEGGAPALATRHFLSSLQSIAPPASPTHSTAPPHSPTPHHETPARRTSLPANSPPPCATPESSTAPACKPKPARATRCTGPPPR